MLKDELMLKQLRSARIQEVRRQESKHAERTADEWMQRQQGLTRAQQEEEAVRFIQRRLYEEKLAQRDQLLRQRQVIEESMGKAQADAAESQRNLLQAQAENESMLRMARERAQQRGEAAYTTLQEEQQARKRLESFQRECRAEVINAEAQRAHDNAEKFRVQQLIAERKRKEEEARRYVPPGGTVLSGPIDYSKTQFHNPVIVRHTPEGQTASQLAEAELQRKLAETEALAARRETQQQVAAERGLVASTAEVLRREQEALLRELKSITMADAAVKLKSAKANPVLYSRVTALAEQQDSAKRKNLEMEYELIMLKDQKQKPKPQAQAWRTTQAATKLAEEPVEVVELPSVQEDRDEAELPEREQSSQQPEKRKILINEGARSDPFRPSKPTSLLKAKEDQPNTKTSLKFPKRAWEAPESPLDQSESEESEEMGSEGESDESEEDVRIPVKAVYTAGESGRDKTRRLYEYEGRRVVETKDRTPSPPAEESPLSSDSELAEASPRYGRYAQPLSDEDEPLYSSHKTDAEHEADPIIEKYLSTKKYEYNDEEKSEESSRGEGGSGERDEDDLRYSVEKVDLPPAQTTPTGPMTKDIRQTTTPRKPEPPLQASELGASHPPQMYPMPYMYPMPMYQPVPMFPTYYPPMQAYPMQYAGSGASYGQSLQFSQSSGSSQSFTQSSGKKGKTQQRAKSPIKVDPVEATPESSLEAPLVSKYSGDPLSIKPKKRSSDNLGLYSAFKTEIAKKTDFTPTLSRLPEEMKVEEPVCTAELKASKVTEEDKLSELDFIESHRSETKHGGELVQIEGESTSLSEAFRARRRDMLDKLSSRTEAPKTHPSKTKEELLEIRKQMLKPQHKVPSPRQALVMDFKEEAKKGPKPEIMARLATGTKTKVSKKEMLQLTAKNYQQLPEVRKKREEEEKREALKKRLATAKAYEQKRKDSKNTTK